MKCPNCESTKSIVSDSRKKERMYRRRKCKDCGTKFTTYEITVVELLDVMDEGGIDENTVDRISNVLNKEYREMTTDRETRSTYNAWTDEEDNIIEKYYPFYGSNYCWEKLKSVTPIHIARRSIYAVRTRAVHLGIRSQRSKKEMIEESWKRRKEA